MAKLSARGRTVQVEAVIEYDATRLQARHDKLFHDDKPALTIWERKTHRLMSDGKVLEKLQMPAGTGVSGLESNGGDEFFCGGGSSGKVRAVRRPRAK